MLCDQLWRHFPERRESKQAVRREIHRYTQLWRHFPVQRESKLNVKRIWNNRFMVFGYTFPREGNRNVSNLICVIDIAPITLATLSRAKGIKTHRALSHVSQYNPLATLSRAKGIETLWCCSRNHPFPLTLATLSRAKGRETVGFHEFVHRFDTLETLSRSKGIETQAALRSHRKP